MVSTRGRQTAVIISNVNVDDGCIYSCTVENSEGVSSCAGTLEIVEESRPPMFTQQLQDISLMDGERFQLLCKVTGYPEPEITWTHGVTKIREKDGGLSYTTSGNCSLTVTEAFPEDAGQYACTAKNCYGMATTTCHVEVGLQEPDYGTDDTGSLLTDSEDEEEGDVTESTANLPRFVVRPPPTLNFKVGDRIV
ncbi:unnamed protein product, partial [Cyprideis torosa]